MGAWQMHLDPLLEGAVMAGALTLGQAWQVQDLMLSTWEEVIELPPHLHWIEERLTLYSLPSRNPQ